MKTRAIVFPHEHRAELDEVEVGDPGPGEVRVKSAVCGICQVEIKKFTGKLPDGPYPMDRLGHEMAGWVEAIGAGVTGLKEGDFVTTLWAPGFRETTVVSRGFVEQAPADGKPEHWISEPASCALGGAISANIQPGERVLIYGAGYMGQLVLQAVRRSLAVEIAVTDLNPDRLELAKRHGADTVALGGDVASLGEFDTVIEAAGARGMIAASALSLKRGGKLVLFSDQRPTKEEIDWHHIFSVGAQMLVSNPSTHADFPAIWRTAVALMRVGVFDQSAMLTHLWSPSQAQEAMEISSAGKGDYIKGAFVWS